MLARYGLVCPSFVAPPPLEELRRLTRLHARTRRAASTLRNMLHRMLDESGLRIGGILTDLFGLSGRNLLDGLVAARTPNRWWRGARATRARRSRRYWTRWGAAGRGRQAAGHAVRDMQEAVERSLADLERRIVEAAEQDYELPWTLLLTLPGRRAASPVVLVRPNCTPCVRAAAWASEG